MYESQNMRERLLRSIRLIRDVDGVPSCTNWTSSKSTNRREERAVLNRILTWPILLDPGHSLLGHSGGEQLRTFLTAGKIAREGQITEHGGVLKWCASIPYMRLRRRPQLQTADTTIETDLKSVNVPADTGQMPPGQDNEFFPDYLIRRDYFFIWGRERGKTNERDRRR